MHSRKKGVTRFQVIQKNGVQLELEYSSLWTSFNGVAGLGVGRGEHDLCAYLTFMYGADGIRSYLVELYGQEESGLV